MRIQIFNTCCLFDEIKNETTLYGQYTQKFSSLAIAPPISYSVFYCSNRPDFIIKISSKISTLDSLQFKFNDKTVETISSVTIAYPFEMCNLRLCSTSAIISTLVKSYSHRLDEWIRYNIQLGFSGIVIFDNDANVTNRLNEDIEHCNIRFSTRDVCARFPGFVWVVDFPNTPFRGSSWDNIQRISLHIGTSAMRTRCRNIALIDADEFIFIPKTPEMSIERFLDPRQSVTLRSNILTNRAINDVLDNNILSLATFVGEDKYTKIILRTEHIKPNEFIRTPHTHPRAALMPKDEIIHYHCWMNARYKYTPGMPEFHGLMIKETKVDKDVVIVDKPL